MRPALRALAREAWLRPANLVAPLFVTEAARGRREIPSMPGQFQLGQGDLLKEAEEHARAGVPALLLFGLPARKDARGSGAWARNGAVQRAVRALKRRFPGLVVMTDVCLCEYTSHGHCGLVRRGRGGAFEIANDPTLELLARTALSHAEAGADVVAPSDMMDGRVAAIRAALDKAGLGNTAILSYAAKYASAFYGPFREAAGSAPSFGDRRSHQMDPGNRREALREMALDLEEGADMLMVKPGLAYLDILREARDRFEAPLAAYSVSAEYSMVKAAAARGWVDGGALRDEILLSMRRAGADLILTYFAKEYALDHPQGA